jgi:excisionase family DNA binding protein
MEKILISITEAASVLSISRAKAYEMIKKQELPRVKVGYVWRVPVEGLRKWVDDHGLEARG